MRDLKEIRKDIDKIDNQLIELFKQRMDCLLYTSDAADE